MISKSQLAILLSKLKPFENPKLNSEQYSTDSETAALFLWFAYMNNDVQGKTIADLGCGTGILGIGCLLLEAFKVYLVDNDPMAIEISKVNLSSLNLSNYELINKDVSEIDVAVDVIIQNPPFGTKIKHSDRRFLLNAFGKANTIYTMHKTKTAKFVKAVGNDNGYKVTHQLPVKMPLKRQYSFHKRTIHKIAVTIFRLEKT